MFWIKEGRNNDLKTNDRLRGAFRCILDSQRVHGNLGNRGRQDLGRCEFVHPSVFAVHPRGDRTNRFKYEGKLMGDELELTRSLLRGGAAGGLGGGARGQGGGQSKPMLRPTTFTAKRVN